jgi:hypothetical protein
LERGGEWKPVVMALTWAMLAVYARILYNHGFPASLALLLAAPLTITTLTAEALIIRLAQRLRAMQNTQ